MSTPRPHDAFPHRQGSSVLSCVSCLLPLRTKNSRIQVRRATLETAHGRSCRGMDLPLNQLAIPIRKHTIVIGKKKNAQVRPTHVGSDFTCSESLTINLEDTCAAMGHSDGYDMAELPGWHMWWGWAATIQGERQYKSKKRVELCPTSLETCQETLLYQRSCSAVVVVKLPHESCRCVIEGFACDFIFLSSAPWSIKYGVFVYRRACDDSTGHENDLANHVFMSKFFHFMISISLLSCRCAYTYFFKRKKRGLRIPTGKNLFPHGQTSVFVLHWFKGVSVSAPTQFGHIRTVERCFPAA
jgi:hypothetical protein